MTKPIAPIHRLSPQVWVCGQVTPAALDELAGDGFTWLVNHRPDGEEPGQPSASEIAEAAERVGLSVRHAPVRGLPDAAAVAATRATLDAMGPEDRAVFFCRSGMRSTAAWAMAQRLAGADADTLRAAAAAAGYDLSQVPL